METSQEEMRIRSIKSQVYWKLDVFGFQHPVLQNFKPRELQMNLLMGNSTEDTLVSKVLES